MTKESDDPVGYKNPPKSTRFRKGGPQPKRSKKCSNAIDLIAMLNEPMNVSQEGKSKKMAPFEIALLKVANDAIKGNMRSIQYLLATFTKFGVLNQINFDSDHPFIIHIPYDQDEEEWKRNYEAYGPPPWPFEPDGLCRLEEHRDAAGR